VKTLKPRRQVKYAHRPCRPHRGTGRLPTPNNRASGLWAGCRWLGKIRLAAIRSTCPVECQQRYRRAGRPADSAATTCRTTPL